MVTAVPSATEAAAAAVQRARAATFWRLPANFLADASADDAERDFEVERAALLNRGDA
ncbi:MAG TPA: hypothetical protein VEA81_00270 [Burkholderiaceae bacterium]|nr:hypothetical protein [Burkholderiaceae bacterium]